MWAYMNLKQVGRMSVMSPVASSISSSTMGNTESSCLFTWVWVYLKVTKEYDVVSS